MFTIKDRYETAVGHSFPVGPNFSSQGVNFCIFSKNAIWVELLFFENADDVEPSHTFRLEPSINKTYYYWHIFIYKVKLGQLYGYRIHGNFAPENGHRFDSSKILLDPYSKAVSIPNKYHRRALSKFGIADGNSPKSVIVDLSLYDWEGDFHPRIPFSRTVIYELHVGGFTKNPNSGVEESKRGTFAGLIEKIPYLVELGITAVELLPVFQFDVQDAPDGKINYWGYSPISFFAPHQGYSTDRDNPLKVLDEFRDMVKALHKAGLEVIMDVVFNHTSENHEDGPTYTFRGIDNSIYYILDQDKAKYKNFSGTGNTLNANQAIVRKMIISSLHFWVRDMHVDGFRFDLASILSRDEKGNPIENAPILWDIESDPILAGSKLIAEAWDASGLYQVGNFTGDSWKEWNGRFRDDTRSFLRGDKGKVGAFVTRLIGSPDIYESKDRESEQSINFVTCHDGFTLYDLVSYNIKHNMANGENNRDGHNDNLSWNCGVEGPTEDPEVLSIRKRQVKNFFTVTLLSLGAPMILMGDEVLHTQKGNNNAYCQDNELTWFDWDLVEKNAEIFRFVKILIKKRLKRETAQATFNLSLKELLAQSKIYWHGVKLNQPDWSPSSLSIAMTILSLNKKMAMHFLINAYHQNLKFEIPKSLDERKITWKIWLDTSLDEPCDICLWSEAGNYPHQTYDVKSHSIVILFTKLE
ncbi:glycogen debranching protein GlgX [Aquiflexum sp. TKW24L]|uniref:glycogen debranching protein GlgX n=1 Tax=Aquiflexum sp. TKW24L TaxID=2942212 RepID=UPI0020C004B2|nr:glycogen debranching protein GlgX [Aquiflexum sp. TKW24L]MCL6260175.1 glycogen debranching protein GlgX [Aquiflexum sp. TKW24L]